MMHSEWCVVSDCSQYGQQQLLFHHEILSLLVYRIPGRDRFLVCGQCSNTGLVFTADGITTGNLKIGLQKTAETS